MRWRGKIITSAVRLAIIIVAPLFCHAQALLSANGPGNTYEDITNVLAPGTGTGAVEAPDTYHPAFGRHISEVFDATLNKFVFEFKIHITPDLDISTSGTDRQRNEIKTYGSSPDTLKGTFGETVTYKWKFRLSSGFQPSTHFTHIHQLKPVDGPDETPIFTLSPRKGTPDKLQLLYADTIPGIPVNSVILTQADLSLFRGVWCEVIEVVTYGDTLIIPGNTGKYSITIQRVDDGTTLLSYYSSNITTIRQGNTFVRPKWGIYRSILAPADLRDDTVRFNDFSIKEGLPFPTSIAYYWVGGSGPVSFTGNSNWNTQIDQSGNSRSVAGALPGDILIVDGSNIGGDTAATGTVTVTVSTNSIGQLKLQRNASVIMQRPPGGGTGTLSINGDGTPAPDFSVLEGSSLTINSSLADGNITIALLANVTGQVGGTITLTNTGTHRITSQVTGGLVFTSGATFNSDGTPSTAAYPFGSSSQSVNNGVVFQSGANLVVTGTRSPMGGTSTFQACQMMPGSNTYIRSNASSANGSWSNLKTYGNIFVQNNSNFTCDGPFYKIDDLTIDNGCTLTTHSSGNTPILGNLLVNGTLTAPGGSTNVLVLGGSTPQIVSGTGSISVPSLTVANYSDVSLAKTITVGTTTNIVGKLDFGSGGQVTGTATFTSRVAGSGGPYVGNVTADTYQINGVTGITSITGLAVTGPGLSPNTNVVGFSSSNSTINISKPALSTASGGIYNFFSDTATLGTSNPNGMDSTTGSVVVTGSKSFQSGTNYIINGNCNWPFGISTSAPSSLTLGKVVINATVTTNKNVVIKNGLYINSGLFNIRSSDTVNVTALNFLRQNNLIRYIKGMVFSDDEFSLENFAFGKQVVSHRKVYYGMYDPLNFSGIVNTNGTATMIVLNSIPLIKTGLASFIVRRGSQYWSFNKAVKHS